MGFSAEAAAENAARKIPAARTADDVLSAHNNTQAHQTWSMRNYCPECDRLRTGGDPEGPTTQDYLE
jgi:hypothetical protein